MKKTFVVWIILIVSVLELSSLMYRDRDFSKGPIYAKNLYLPYMIYYTAPGLMAKSGEKFAFNYHITTYLTNDFLLEELTWYWDSWEDEQKYRIDVLRDYESITTEYGFSFNIMKSLTVGADFRFYIYHGGFLDNIIEGFHHAFGFPNGAREFKFQDDVEVDISGNDNNVVLRLNEPTISFGDIDLWVKYTFFEKKHFSFALSHAVKIPTGSPSGLSGSGYPDIAFSLLADLRPFWVMSFYVQTGIVIPIDGLTTAIETNPYPMFNGLLAIEINPADFFSFIVQMNFKSSPLSGIYMYHNLSPDEPLDYIALPQTNILIGMKFHYKGMLWQVYFEEDAVTNAGTDITIGLLFSHTIGLRKYLH